MMSPHKVARTISDIHGLSPADAERIAAAAAHRRRAATECFDVSHGQTVPAPPDPGGGVDIPLHTLAHEICAVAAIPLGDALVIAGRVMARVALQGERHGEEIRLHIPPFCRK